MFFPFIKHRSIHIGVFFILNLVLSCSTDESDILDRVDPSADESDMVDPTDSDEPVTEEETPKENSIDENFKIDFNKNQVNYIVSQEDYTKFITGVGDMKMVSNAVYQYFKDDFDYIMILSIEETQPSGLYFGVSFKVKNDVMGIGSSVYDNTASYGSQGALKSVLYMPKTEYIRNGPFLHEIAHYWGNHGVINTTVGGHWGYASTGGQLGGFDELITLGGNMYRGRLDGEDGFGTFANGGNTVPYGNLELYLMGLIGPEALDPIQVAENPVNIAGTGMFTASSIATITPGMFITQNGARMPATQNAQKIFKGIAVVISTTAISAEKATALQSDLDNFTVAASPVGWGNALNFWEATQGKATFSFELTAENLKP